MNRQIDSGRRRFQCALAGVMLLAALHPGARAGAFDDFFRATRNDDAQTVGVLLQRGFDPNATEPVRGETGLMIAVREGAAKVFQTLLNARDLDIERRAFNGDTVLMIAAFRGNKGAVNALLDKGAEINSPGWTALHYAAAAGQNEIVRVLLDRAAYIDAESPRKLTPIMMAAREGHIYTVKLLLDEGADATLKNSDGKTAMDIARSVGRSDIADGLEFRLKRATRP